MTIKEGTLGELLAKLGDFEQKDFGELQRKTFSQTVYADLQRVYNTEDREIVPITSVLFFTRIRSYLNDILLNAEMWGGSPVLTTAYYGKEAGKEGVVYSVVDHGAGFDMYGLLQKAFKGMDISSREGEHEGGRGIVEMHNGFGQPTHPNIVCQDTVDVGHGAEDGTDGSYTRVNMYYPLELEKTLFFHPFDVERKRSLMLSFFETKTSSSEK